MPRPIRAAIIRKSESDLRPAPNLDAGDAARRGFSWGAMASELGLGLDGFVNIGHAAVDRHLGTAVRDRIAFRFVARDLRQHDVSFAELARQTNRFANVLRGLGLGKGSRVFILAGRIPELYIAVLGALKNGSVVTPLFSAFGPEPIKTRLALGDADALVTTESLYTRKVAGITGELPRLAHVLLVGETGAPTQAPGTRDLATLMALASDEFEVERTACRRHGARALHQRHDGHAQRRRPRPRRRRHALRNRQVRA